MIIAMRIKMQGFIVFDYAKRYPEARKELMQWLEEGKLQRKETIVKGGLQAAEGALAGLFSGTNTGESTFAFRLHQNLLIPRAGKLLVEVKHEDSSRDSKL